MRALGRQLPIVTGSCQAGVADFAFASRCHPPRCRPPTHASCGGAADRCGPAPGASRRAAPLSRRATPLPAKHQTQAPGGGRPLSQDRIASDGSWWSGGGAPARSAASEAQPYVIGSATAPGPTAPATAPASDAAIDRLADLLQRARGSTLILTGAGCSTESGVPDYRGPAGAYTTSNFKPMSHQQFMASPANRERYWARSFAGWPRFSTVQPNAAHDSIARLQHRGWARALITQNVDRLHAKAGSKQVLELHGTTHEVVCMGCSRLLPRHDFQQTLADLNPAAAAAVAALGAREDAADERERLLRAGSAAAVGPSLRVGSAGGGLHICQGRLARIVACLCIT